jgi:hypothetical protein
MKPFLAGMFFAFGYVTARNLVRTFDAFLAYRSTLRAARAHLKAWENRPRAKIVQVGHLIKDELGNFHPTDFKLRGTTEQGMVPIWEHGPNGELAWGGYTKEELVEIVRRRKEFEG